MVKGRNIRNLSPITATKRTQGQPGLYNKCIKNEVVRAHQELITFQTV